MLRSMTAAHRTLLILTALCFGACADETVLCANIAPSAAGQADDIAHAVFELNEFIGEDVFSIRMADSGDVVEGEIVIRQDDSVTGLLGAPGTTVIGETREARKGWIIRIAKRPTVRGIAHELGHAAGLDHVDDPGNLMYKTMLPEPWTLTEEQIDAITGR